MEWKSFVKKKTYFVFELRNRIDFSRLQFLQLLSQLCDLFCEAIVCIQ